MVNSQCAFGHAPQGGARHGPFPYNIWPCRFLKLQVYPRGGLRDRTGADHFEKCPVGGALLDMRDLAQMLAHVHDARLKYAGSGAARPVALDLKAKPTVNHPPTDGCYHVAKTRTGL